MPRTPRRRIYPNFRAYIESMTSAGERQTQIAARLGISESYLSDIKNGRTRPGFRLAARLAAQIGMPLESFLTGEGS